MARHPERYYSWIADANIVVPEVLLVPLHQGDGVPLGTLWIVSEQTDHFNRSHVVSLTELALFVSIALRTMQNEVRLKKALGEQQTLAMEMSHRVKNVFQIVDGMIDLTAKRTSSKDELAKVLSGRIRALGKAHGLVRKNFVDEDGISQAADLETLLRAIVGPHVAPVGQTGRFSLQGPPVLMGTHATNGMALVFHELATNALKYGGLANESGTVHVNWTLDGHDLRLQWIEGGGPRVAEPPTTTGFGTQLVRQTVEGILGGAIRYDWKTEGLELGARFSLERLKS